MKRLTITRARIAWGALGAFILVLFVSSLLFNAPLSDNERASWATRFADRHAYSDSRLREMAAASDPEMAALLNNELARRGARK